MIRDDDVVLNALLSSGKEHAPDISVEFLRKVYEIQDNYQFEKDSDIRIRLLERLVEEYIDNSNQKRTL